MELQIGNTSEEEGRGRQITALSNVDSIRKQNTLNCGRYARGHGSYPRTRDERCSTRGGPRLDIGGMSGLQQPDGLVPAAGRRFLLKVVIRRRRNGNKESQAREQAEQRESFGEPPGLPAAVCH